LRVSTPTHPLQVRDYRLIWLARFISTAATTAMVVVMGAQVYQIARTDYGMGPKEAAFLLGMLGLVQFLPFMLLTPVAGVLADRMDRRHLGAIATAVDLLIGLALAAANTWGFVSLPLLFGLAACYGAARVFIGPAISAITPNVVPPDLLPKAIATSSIAWQSAAVIGPAAGGFLLAAHPSLPYWYASAMLLLAVATLLAIHHRAPPAAAKEPPLKLMADGAKFVWRERFLLGCVTLDLFAVLLGGATALLPVFARDVLHVGPEGLGQMRAAPAAGAMVVADLAWFPADHHNVGAKMLWAVAAFGACDDPSSGFRAASRCRLACSPCLARPTWFRCSSATPWSSSTRPTKCAGASRLDLRPCDLGLERTGRDAIGPGGGLLGATGGGCIWRRRGHNGHRPLGRACSPNSNARTFAPQSIARRKPAAMKAEHSRHHRQHAARIRLSRCSPTTRSG
jgi:MFS family permease